MALAGKPVQDSATLYPSQREMLHHVRFMFGSLTLHSSFVAPQVAIPRFGDSRRPKNMPKSPWEVQKRAEPSSSDVMVPEPGEALWRTQCQVLPGSAVKEKQSWPGPPPSRGFRSGVVELVSRSLSAGEGAGLVAEMRGRRRERVDITVRIVAAG